MTSNSEAPKQDMPPPGGYRKFNFARTFPKVVWRPGVMVGVIAGCTTYGAFQTYMHKKHNQTEKFEDVDIHNAMEPFLTAERVNLEAWLKLLKKNRDLENEVMKNVPGWVTGTWYGEPVYYTLGEKWWGVGSRTEEFFVHASRKTNLDDHLWRHHSECADPKFYDKWIPESEASIKNEFLFNYGTEHMIR
ncbi:hypothetical protein L596_027253 [Steinernema carpocapsae]|uniref:NADH dehydrogenase [ubiquinone] 1 alpha subcomplex subunit 13 n=1 Tax=Steinernema carpocapsae TaxID=34508 RepID=A0A4U5M3R9_STECR|nr:hypothetical protein L596_027253 [Steinernema carpocapsae]